MEEKQDDLDNLIIQSQKPSGLKKILLAAAILLLVLILIILVTKSLIEDENRPSSSVILPPEPVTQPSEPAKEPLFKQVPIEEENGSEKRIEQAIERLKQNAPKEVQHTEKEAPKAAKKYAKPETPKQVTEKEQTKAAAAVTKEEKPKTSETAGKYFIQVGAFFRYPPDKKFLDSIKKENLNYIIVEGTKSGKPYKKVLVGPYQSRSAAKKDLDRVKKRINQNAYITTKK